MARRPALKCNIENIRNKCNDKADPTDKAPEPEFVSAAGWLVSASRFTVDNCVAIFERAFDRLRAACGAEFVRHAEFLEALDDYDIVLTAPPDRAK